MSQRKVLLTSTIQRHLLDRLMSYWCFYLVALLLVISSLRFYKEGFENPLRALSAILSDGLPAVLCAVILFPVFALDLLKLSNRVVGPIGRLRACLHKLASGEKPPAIELRSDDLLQGLCHDFNELLRSLPTQGDCTITHIPKRT